MFSKYAAMLILASSLIAGALGKPVPTNHEVPVDTPIPEESPVPVDVPVYQPPVQVDVPVQHGTPIVSSPHKGFSFNNWGGFASLNKFDDFYGLHNFDGSRNFKQTFVKDAQLVCRTQEVTIVQQRLLVLQELAKKIILEQVCEVEVQTIVFEQFYGGLGSFNHDLLRLSGRQVGFDRRIVGQFPNIINGDGSLTSHDLGFKGLDLGSQTVLVGGSNWDDTRSPASVFSAFGTARSAFNFLH